MSKLTQIEIQILVIGFLFLGITTISDEYFFNNCETYVIDNLFDIICSNGSIPLLLPHIITHFKSKTYIMIVFKNMYIERLSNEDFGSISEKELYNIHFMNNEIENLEIGKLLINHKFTNNIITNMISSSDPEAFDTNSNSIYTIYFNNNTIINFDQGLFNSLYNNRKFIRMEHCNITEIPAGVFSNISFVYIIDLSYNSFLKLEEGSFFNISMDKNVEWMYEYKNSTIINLHNCDLETFEPGTFNQIEIQKLDLSFNAITEIPKGVFIQSKIFSIDLSNNNIEQLELIDLGDLGYSLQVLSLVNNNIMRLPPEVFKKNVELAYLNFLENPIEIVEPNAFVGLRSIENRTYSRELKSLHLPYSLQLFQLNPFIFNGLNYMLDLNLNGRGVQEISPHAFYGMIRLEYLRLNNNNISTITPGAFIGLYSLTIIELENNQISILNSKSFIEFRYSPYLYLINLARNLISDIPDNMFKNTPTLYVLNLGHNSLTVLKKRMFLGLKKLTYLYLEYNRITYIQKSTTLSMLSLTYVNLKSNNLFYMDAENFIKNLKSLKTVDVTDNPLVCSFAEKINEIQMWRNKIGTNEINFLPYSNNQYSACENMTDEISDFDLSKLEDDKYFQNINEDYIFYDVSDIPQTNVIDYLKSLQKRGQKRYEKTIKLNKNYDYDYEELPRESIDMPGSYYALLITELLILLGIIVYLKMKKTSKTLTIENKR